MQNGRGWHGVIAHLDEPEPETLLKVGEIIKCLAEK